MAWPWGVWVRVTTGSQTSEKDVDASGGGACGWNGSWGGLVCNGWFGELWVAFFGHREGACGRGRIPDAGEEGGRRKAGGRWRLSHMNH